jgi:hypothetical protein
VVEGNSRLAAYRLLADDNAIKWAKVKCALLPKAVDDSAIASLLGHLHLKGKKDWRPYEQAAFLYRRHKKDKITIPALKREFNISEGAIKHRIAVIAFMIRHNDNTVGRWSHYDEFLKSKKIKKACEDHADLEETIVERIKSGAIKKAADLRDKLKVVCGVRSEQPLKQFISGKASLEDAFKTAKSLGGDNKPLQNIKRFRTWFGEADTKRGITEATKTVRQEIAYELRQIRARSDTLLKSLK